jgi:hypothetical protein
VAKLLEVCRNFGDQQSVRYLWKATFDGRRKEIVSNKFDNVQHILQTACLVLNQADYVSKIFFSFYIELYLTDICFLLKFQLVGEFEMVTCSGTCRKFMDNWVTHVPLILKFTVRTKKRNDAVSKVFQTYQESDILNPFGNESNFYFHLIFANFV